MCVDEQRLLIPTLSMILGNELVRKTQAKFDLSLRTIVYFVATQLQVIRTEPRDVTHSTGNCRLCIPHRLVIRGLLTIGQAAGTPVNMVLGVV